MQRQQRPLSLTERFRYAGRNIAGGVFFLTDATIALREFVKGYFVSNIVQDEDWKLHASQMALTLSANFLLAVRGHLPRWERAANWVFSAGLGLIAYEAIAKYTSPEFLSSAQTEEYVFAGTLFLGILVDEVGALSVAFNRNLPKTTGFIKAIWRDNSYTLDSRKGDWFMVSSALMTAGSAWLGDPLWAVGALWVLGAFCYGSHQDRPSANQPIASA